MGKADRFLTTQDVLHLAYGEHGTAADSTPTVLVIGGKYVAQPTAVDGSDVVVLWLDEKGYSRPHLDALQLETFTTAATSGTSTPVTALGAFRDVDVTVDVSAASGTSPTLDIYLDGRLDGTAYANIARLTQVTTAGQYVAHLSKRQSAGQVTVTSDAGAGTTRAIGWGDALRVRRVIGGTSPSFSARVWGVFV